MRKNRLALFVIAALLVFGAIWALVLNRRSEGSSTSKVRIGVILAESGPADFIGKPERAVLEAMMNAYSSDSHNAPQLELVYSDSRGQPPQATVAFENFIRDTTIRAIIGPSTSGESIALAKEAERYQIPLLSLAASRDIVVDTASGRTNPWVFKFAQNDDLAAKRLLSAMASQGDTTIALLYSDDPFGRSGARVVRTQVDSSPPLRIIHEYAFPAALTQAGPVVASIPRDVDAVLIWGTAPGPALIVKALREDHRSAQIYLSHGNASEEFLNSTGAASETAIVVGSRVLLDLAHLRQDAPADVAIISYRQSWASHSSGSPSHFGGHARDALVALVTVVDSGAITRKDIRDRLESLGNFPGVTGTFRFTPNDHAGLTTEAFETYRIQQGRFVPLGRN
jgi:branched-chain amino acid transport system substrate-binding protein